MAHPYTDLLDQILEQIIIPLEDFEKKASEVDRIHWANYQNFVDHIGSLFNDPPAMVGQGAEALLAKLDDYMMAERFEVGYGDDYQLSSVIDQASQYCKTAANNLMNLLLHFPLPPMPFPDPDDQQPPPDIPDIPVEFVEDVFLSMANLGPNDTVVVTPDMLDITRNADIPRRHYAVTGKQLDVLTQMGQERRRWQNNMWGLLLDPHLELNLPDPPNNLSRSFITLPPIVLTPEQQQEVGEIMGELNADGITGIDQQYVEELLQEGFSENDIIAAIEGWKAAGKTPDQINDLLFLAAFHILLGPYYHDDMIPYGVSGPQYSLFVSTLRDGLTAAGYCSGAGLGGSAITGYSYDSGRPFDGDPNNLKDNRPSDYDVVLTGDELWKRAHEANNPRIDWTDGGTRSKPLTKSQLQELGLYGMQQQLEGIAGRDVHFVIYDALVTTSSKAPAIYFFGNSCAGGS